MTLRPLVALRLRAGGPDLSTPIGQLRGWWIDLHCAGCGRWLAYPMRLLSTQIDPRTTPADVIQRFKRKQCGGRPGSAVATDNPASGGTGGPTWGIELQIPAENS